MAGLWFRVYDEALDDPRLQRLPASLFRTWFNVLCVASRNGGVLPEITDLAWMLRTRPGALSRRLDALKAAGLLEETDGRLRPVEWEKRQFVERPADPTAAERMRRFRERAADRNGAVTPTVTNAPIEEEASLDQDSLPAPERGNASDAFDEFWQAFPKRDGDNPKAPARAEWGKAIAGGADPQRVIAAAKAYAAATAGRERKYVASAARWLSERRWQSDTPQQSTSTPAPLGVWISATSPEWPAWAELWRATKGKSPPVDAKGGWRFPSKHPPAPLERAA
jgi:hypothetical protein